MYEIVEFYDDDGCDLEDILKKCIYRYYIDNKNISKKEEYMKTMEC